MTDFRTVTESFSVAPQIGPEDVARAKAEGFVLLINNRPEGESPDQTPGDEIEALARAAGLDYLAIPIAGGPRRDQAEAQADAVTAVTNAGGKVLAYCRSGTRSINTWALGEALADATPRDELVRLGAAAGYDLRPLLG
jgi:uncharacterized protein (TIGR01244 family)